jgi:glutamate-1-semialdehyde 2,1-aminomutase
MRFVSSGTEAVMSALRAARGFTKRDRVIKFEGCYHGHSDGMLVKAGSGLATFGEPSSAGVPRGFADLTTVLPLDDLEALEQAFAKLGPELAAVIIEPIPANNGLLVQDLSFLNRLRELCTRNGTVLIFDEVISGFRVAPGGAAELFSITPDLVTYGKIIGGGMPVGLYGGRKDIMAVISPDGPVYQAGTLSGNPVAMAAGLATLEKLTPNLYRDLEHKGARWATAFEKIPGLHVPRVGSLLWPLFQPGVKRADRVESGAIAKFNHMHGLMLEQGIYLPPSGFEVAFLSAAHGDEELAHFERAVGMVGQELRKA